MTSDELRTILLKIRDRLKTQFGIEDVHLERTYETSFGIIKYKLYGTDIDGDSFEIREDVLNNLLESARQPDYETHILERLEHQLYRSLGEKRRESISRRYAMSTTNSVGTTTNSVGTTTNYWNLDSIPYDIPRPRMERIDISNLWRETYTNREDPIGNGLDEDKSPTEDKGRDMKITPRISKSDINRRDM